MDKPKPSGTENKEQELPFDKKIKIVKDKLVELQKSRIGTAKSQQQLINLTESIDLLNKVYLEAKAFDLTILKRYKPDGGFVLEKDSTESELCYQQATAKFHLHIYSVLSLFNHFVELLRIPPFRNKIKKQRSVGNSLKIWDEVASSDLEFLKITDLLKASYIYRTYLDHPWQFPVMNWLTTYGKNILVIYYQVDPEAANSGWKALFSEFKFVNWDKFLQDPNVLFLMNTVTQTAFFIVPSYEDTFNCLLIYLKQVTEYFIEQKPK